MTDPVLAPDGGRASAEAIWMVRRRPAHHDTLSYAADAAIGARMTPARFQRTTRSRTAPVRSAR
jgi:hypothetical protein